MENLPDKPWQSLTADPVVQLPGVNLSAGLSTEEVSKRQQKFGVTRFTAQRGWPIRPHFRRRVHQCHPIAKLIKKQTEFHGDNAVAILPV